LLTAFSTASSSATLPVTMDCVENRAGVSNRICSFVLPLGATVNMDGTALYECVAAMFIAQAYGVQLSFAAQFTIVLLALLTSIGVAGIPAASLVAISIILTAVGLPLEGIGLILAVDRVLDMCRTSVNVFSDSCGAVVIGCLEGENGILRKSPV
jgi:proton glutamate symport protein